MVLVSVLLVVLSACGAPRSATATSPDLPPIDGPGIRQLLSKLDRPAVVNVWASWCMPCRSEAPLIDRAHAQRPEVEFIGVDVQDNQTAAKDFIAEFGLDFDQYFDPNRSVPAELGGFGTPITYFVAPGGEVIEIHSGVLDERTLALMIDELTN
ncbi:MAG: TlpA disulfide reductase family protein [Acidimicrobiia bacterium]